MTLKKEHYVFGALVALFLIIVGYEGYTNYTHYGHHAAMHGTAGGMMGSSMLGFSLLFWVLLFAFVFLIFKYHEDSGEEEDTAIEIIKERYARGEITKEQYLEMFKDLKKRE